jgi:hypothetical protein|tara:strand:- start:14825 stop:16051 length:1227 start_codon:yes stop_codon:yes gene_type:complete
MKNIDKIHIWDLPGNLVYVDLADDIKKGILDKAIKFAKTWNNLRKEIGLPKPKTRSSHAITNIRRNYKIQLSVLKNILHYLDANGCNFDRNLIEKNITILAAKSNGGSKFANAIINPNLPFNFNTTYGSRVLSSIFFDGGIDSDLYPHYRNNKIKLRKLVHESYIRVFGKITAPFSNYKNREQIYFPKIIGTILVNTMNIAPGRKTKNNPAIPELIMCSSEEMKAIFLQQAFDDEGHVHLRNKSIQFKLACINNGHPPNLLVGIRKLLNDINIKYSNIRANDIYKTKEGQINRKWSFSIHGENNLKNFEKKINFILPYKSKALSKILEFPYQKQYSRNTADDIILNACKNLELREGKILSRTLAKEINRTQYRAKQVISKFVRNDILKVAKPRHGTNGAEYKLTISSE